MTRKRVVIAGFGDTGLVLSQQLGEWCGHGPVLEEDIALTNIALDILGQARFWLALQSNYDLAQALQREQPRVKALRAA